MALSRAKHSRARRKRSHCRLSAKLNTDETFLWLAQNILMQQLNYATKYLGSACQTPCVNNAITHFRCTDKTIHNHAILLSHLTQAKFHQITRKNSTYWQINTSGLFPYTHLIQVHGCTVTRSADQHRLGFTPGKSWPGSKVICNFALT